MALVVASTVVAVLLAEFALRFVVNPRDFLPATLIGDPVLGRRVLPLTTGHDALGFRNPEVPSHVDIVAIGDSFTYGYSAASRGSWPHQLSGLLGQPVYNMGLGGFGPLQYLHLVKETAKPLSPRLLIVAFYFGNDMMDAYEVAHSLPYWHAWRQSEGATGTENDDRALIAEPKRRFEGLRGWLARNSALYWVLRATVLKRFVSLERNEMVRSSPPDILWGWTDPAKGDLQTVFTAQKRLTAVDLGVPKVREGMQISQRALAALQVEADKQGARLLMVLIPSKERAYCGYLKESGASLPTSFSRLCDAETQTKAELIQFLVEEHFVFVDLINALEAQIRQHVRLYPQDYDGHLEAAGYGVVAKEVAAAIRRYAMIP